MVPLDALNLLFHNLENFTRQLELRFGASIFFNHEAQLYRLKQQTTVNAYQGEFESLSTQVRSLNHNNLLNYFFLRLCKDIQRELYLFPDPSNGHGEIGVRQV